MKNWLSAILSACILILKEFMSLTEVAKRSDLMASRHLIQFAELKHCKKTQRLHRRDTGQAQAIAYQ